MSIICEPYSFFSYRSSTLKYQAPVFRHTDSDRAAHQSHIAPARRWFLFMEPTPFVVDNGSYNIKAGFAASKNPKKYRNTLARSRDGRIHISNDYVNQTQHYSGLVFKRPFDQGHLTTWEVEKPIWDYCFDDVGTSEFEALLCSLVLTETPFQLPQLSINTDQIVFEEYGFSQYYRCTPASLVPWIDGSGSPADFQVVIDAGYNATWIIPIIYQNVYWKGVKKLPVGGHLLNGLLREMVSFRHYDILDEPILVNTIKEQTCFLATDYQKTLRNHKKYSCNFVLPDFKTTATGYVVKDGASPPTDAQSLTLSDERFSVPEALYHPEIIFDNVSTSNTLLQLTPFKNLPDLVVECIMACPVAAQPLLLANIHIVGGSSLLPNFKLRLHSELVKELPLDWFVQLKEHEKIAPDERPWHGAVKLTESDIFEKISISKQEYFEHGSNWCQKQFGFRNL